MTDWQSLARARRLDIPEAQVDAIAPTLDALEAAFAKLETRLTSGADSAAIFRAEEDAE